MTGIIKVDTIQNNGGTTGLTIDSSEDVCIDTASLACYGLSANATINTSAQRITFLDYTVLSSQGISFNTSAYQHSPFPWLVYIIFLVPLG